MDEAAVGRALPQQWADGEDGHGSRGSRSRHLDPEQEISTTAAADKQQEQHAGRGSTLENAPQAAGEAASDGKR